MNMLKREDMNKLKRYFDWVKNSVGKVDICICDVPSKGDSPSYPEAAI